ncbi:mis18-binding protein 1 isoform X2 [Entelurus aequoreus]|uniref:mis18-binding protein 1 isoform X2 n=1 Tax=Entelurus aequoreus TaxID=161455 RepID=UPI002B1E0F92|nr:mis18-binding protein 1 isoform X2 [Entelurus aequoreus]
MAVPYYVWRRPSSEFNSPAKLFAKLKAKASTKVMYANEGGLFDEEQTFEEEYGEELSPPLSITDSDSVSEGNVLNDTTRYGQVKALTLSPLKSPDKRYSNRRAVDNLHITDTGKGFRSQHNKHPMESTAMFSRDIYAEPVPCCSVNLETTNTQVKRAFKDEFAPVSTSMLSDTHFSPMKKKFKTSKHLLPEMNDKTNMEDPESEEMYLFTTSQNTCKHLHPHPISPRMKRCAVFTDNLMSPAKIFAYIKERENRKLKGKYRDTYREPLNDGGDRCRSPSLSWKKFDEDNAQSDSNSKTPVTMTQVKVASCQPDTRHPKEAASPVVASEPILLEDPIVFKTPRIAIPKKRKAVFKNKQWPKPKENTTNEGVIYLKKWFLRRNRKGMFVDGIRVEDNIQWNSNIIVERFSNTELKTVSGRVYSLVGKMEMDVKNRFPMWLLRRFVNGFPVNWKELYEKFLFELQEENLEPKSQITRTASETSALIQTRKRPKKTPVRTSDSCLPCSSSTLVSRSGRLIKPPLEYWKGGRVIADADMNITVFEGYNTPIDYPVQVSPAKSSGAPPQLSQALQDSTKSCQHKFKSDGEPQAPLRKVKAPVSKHNVKKQVQPENNLSVLTRAAMKKQSHPTTSSDKQSSDKKKLPFQREAQKPAVWSSKKKAHKAEVPPLSISLRNRTIAQPQISENAKLSESLEDKDMFIAKKTKRDKRQRIRKLSASNPCPEKTPRKAANSATTINVAQTKTQSRKTKPTPPAKFSAKFSRCSAAQPHVQDAQWTQDELEKLQKAVSKYPVHALGYWEKVAMMVGTRSAEECHKKHTLKRNTTPKSTHKTKKEKAGVPKDHASIPDCPVITAKVGTLRRKQQVRHFLENMPGEDMEDAFSTAYMQNKRLEVPSIGSGDDMDLTLGNVVPQTPISSDFPEAKTPNCITPGMMFSPHRSNSDKYVFQLQKKMKRNRFNVAKRVPTKSITPTPSVKQTEKKWENTEKDSFVVREMFPDKASMLLDSGEEEDFYFSDDDQTLMFQKRKL